MKKKLFLFFITSISFLGLSSFITNEDPISALLKKLDEYTKKYPQEKVHLHLDKPYYAAGDDIWFKAYIIDSRSSELSTISSSLYVELVDDGNRVQKQLKMPIRSGVSWGDFKLVDTLNEGNYRIRAYTQYMRNAGPEFFFDKAIKIGNSWSNEVFIKASNGTVKENNIQKTSNILLFADKAGAPYAARDVSYEVALDAKKTASGKLTTNAKGEVNIPIGASTNSFRSGIITATITLPSKQKVTKTIAIKAIATLTNIQFFPEGGSLVAGLPTRVALKAVGSSGLGEAVSGRIIDNDNNEVTKFETSALGMGSVFFTPAIGKTYTALAKSANGTEQRIKLPQVEKSGYILSINNTDSLKLSIRVLLSPELMNKGELTLIGQHNGEVYFNTKIQTTKPISSIVVDKTDFVSGILQFTLFGPNTEPICERLVFINNSNDKIGFEIQGLNPTYGKRENVGLNLTAINDGAPVSGTFSVAVTNASVVAPDPENETNILTSLLLTSDLVGNVERPNRYFLESSDKMRTELDDLMLTQGWRKINWKAIADGIAPVNTFAPEKDIRINGLATNAQGKPAANTKINLFTNSKAVLTSETVTDQNGRFSFGPLDFTDGTVFLINPSNKANKDIKFRLDATPQPSAKSTKDFDIEVNVNEGMKDYLKKSEPYFEELVKSGKKEKAIQLKQIDVTERKLSPTGGVTGLHKEGRADWTVTAKDLENSLVLEDYIPRIPGLYVEGGRIYTRNGGLRNLQETATSSNMLVVVNGLPYSSFSVNTIPIGNIAKIEVLTSPNNTVMYGGRAEHGVLVITTRMGPLDSNENSTGQANVFMPKGYAVTREFYAPKYDVAAKDSPDVDLRTTVYWAPNLISTKDGKFNFNYFNTDQPGNYRIVIEGIDDLGNLARKTYEYKIN